MDDLIGRTDLLEPRNIKLAKTKSLDLSSLLNPIAGSEDRTWLSHNLEAHGNGTILEDILLKDAKLIAAIKNHGHASRTLKIVNTDRSVCARISGEIAQQHGNNGFLGKLNLINVKFLMII